MDDALRVREFWFGKPLTAPPKSQDEAPWLAAALKRRASLWFQANPQLMSRQDELIRSRFQDLVERAGRGELTGWADSPRRRLSLIILLDQFPRHIYRGTAQAFAYDTRALGLALSGMYSAADAALTVIERLFFYMPLQHAESTEVQDESVSAYKRLVADSPAQLRSTFEEALQEAEEHRALIHRFGRFPHRNQALGRESTAEEDAYLKMNGEASGHRTGPHS